MESRFTLDNFELKFSKTDERLLIQAQDKATGTQFSKAITQESAKALSQDHILDPDMIYELLRDFFKNKQDNDKLSLTKDGTLAYSCQVMYGRIAKQLSFTIELDIEGLDQDKNKLEKLVNKLSERVYELEKRLGEKNEGRSKEEFEKFTAANERFLAFEKLIVEKFERIEDLERIVTRVEGRMQALEDKFKGPSDLKKDRIEEVSTIDWKFNKASHYGSRYTYLNHNKTAIAKEGATFSLFAQQPLPKDKKTEFTLMIEGPTPDMNYLAVGIASEASLKKNNCYDEKRTFFLTYHGHVSINGESNLGYPGYTRGDKVSFSVDMSTGVTNASINGIHIYKHTFIKDGHFLYPCIVTSNSKGVGATFV